MSLRNFIRMGGALLIVSGLALGYSYVTHPHDMPPDVIASTSWFVIHALFAVSLVFGLLGTTALYGATALRVGTLGLIGFILLFIGMMMIFGLDYYEVVIAPFLAINYPQVIVDYGPGDTMGAIAIAFPLAGMLTVIGYAMLGLAWKRTRVLPSKVALALIVTSIMFGIGLSPVGGLIFAQATAAGFGASLVATGICAIRRNQDFSSNNL